MERRNRERAVLIRTTQYVQKAFCWGKFVHAQVVEANTADLLQHHQTGDIVALIARWNREGSRTSSITGLTWQYVLVDPAIPVKNVPIFKQEFVDWDNVLKDFRNF